jgi:hypothetical protein
VVLDVASLEGHRLAVLLFALLATVLGGATGVALWNRLQCGRHCASLAGVALTLGLFALVYESSLDGFCRIEVSGDRLRLERAVPWASEERLLAEPYGGA